MQCIFSTTLRRFHNVDKTTRVKSPNERRSDLYLVRILTHISMGARRSI